VRIRKDRIRFAKAAEQKFSTGIFTFAKLIERRAPAVYEIEDLNGTLIDGQICRDELTPCA